MTTNVLNRRIIYTPALASGGGTPATTWNPSDQFNETFSNANLTAANATANVGGTRAIVGITTGQKKYWEVLIVTAGSTPGLYPGVANTTKDLTGGLMISGTNSAGYYYDGTSVHFYVNFAGFDIATSFTDGDRICLAVDFDAKKAWGRINNGNWNGAAIGSQNPVGAVGGLDLTPITGTLYPAFQTASGAATTVITGVFSSASWLFTNPTGFTQIDA